MNDTPASRAHELAQTAEEYFEQGNYAKAIECHYRAAEQFLRATEFTTDPMAAQTLKLMCQQQTRSAKELEKRLNQQKPQIIPQKTQRRTGDSSSSSPSGSVSSLSLTRSPSSHQKWASPTVSPRSSTYDHVQLQNNKDHHTRIGSGAIHLYTSPILANAGLPKETDSPTLASTSNPRPGIGSSTLGSRQFFVGQDKQQWIQENVTNDNNIVFSDEPREIQHRDSVIIFGGAAQDDDDNNGPATMPVTVLDPKPSQFPHESVSTVRAPEQSYLVLDGNAKIVDDPDYDKNDPFTRFWETVEGLVQRFPASVALTTAPLGNEPQPLSHQATQRSDRFLGRNSGLHSSPTSYMITNTQMTPSHQTRFLHQSVIPLADSYMFVPTGSEIRSSSSSTSTKYTKTMEEYHMENEQLKAAVDQLTRRVMELEKAGRENDLLKSSIIKFRQEVQRQGKRFGSSALSFSALGPNSMYQASAQQYEGRIAELEAQLRQQSILLQKYQDKWAKLKETAKKRKEGPEPQGESIVVDGDKESENLNETDTRTKNEERTETNASTVFTSTPVRHSTSPTHVSSPPDRLRTSLLSTSLASSKIRVENSSSMRDSQPGEVRHPIDTNESVVMQLPSPSAGSSSVYFSVYDGTGTGEWRNAIPSTANQRHRNEHDGNTQD